MKALKYLTYALGLILLTMLLLLAFTQTAWFKSIAKDQLERLVSEQLNASVSIGEIEGNFFNKLSVHQLALTGDADSTEMASLEALRIRYSLFKLLRNKIQLDSIVLTGLDVELMQLEDSTWNIAHVLPTRKEKKDTVKASFPFAINADNIIIRNMQLKAQSYINILPNAINDINLETSFYYDSTLIKTQLKAFSLVASEPDIRIDQLSAIFQKQKKEMQLDSLVLQTRYSSIGANASYEGLSENRLDLESNPLSNEELKIFIPSIRLLCAPVIETDFYSSNDSSFVDFNLGIDGEQIHLKAQFLSLSKVLNKEKVKVPYVADVKFVNVHPEKWWEMPNTKSTINGVVSIAGNDLFNYKDGAKLFTNLSNSSYQDFKFDSLLINADQKGDRIKSQLKLRSRLGSARGSIVINSLFDNPEYETALDIENILLSEIIPSIDSSGIRGYVRLRGRGFSLKDINASSSIDLKRSVIYNVPIDSANIELSLLASELGVSLGHLFLPGAKVDVSGNYGLKNRGIDMKAIIESDSLQFLDEFKLPEFDFHSVTTTAKASGNVDSLVVNGEVLVQSFKGFSIESNRVGADYTFNLLNGQFSSSANVLAEKFVSGGVLVDTVEANLNYQDSRLKSELNLMTDSVNVFMRSALAIGDTISVNIPEMEVLAPFLHYYIADSINAIHYSDHKIEVDNLLFKSKLNDQFLLKADGQINNIGAQDFSLSIKNLDLQRINRFNIIPEAIHGFLSTNLMLSGQPSSPNLVMDFQLTPGSYGEWQTPAFEGIVMFKEQKLNTQLLVPALGNDFELNYSSPLVFVLDSSGLDFQAPETFNAQLRIDSVDITQPLEKEQINVSAGGSVWADLEVSGKFSEPQFYGNLGLRDGLYLDEKYGFDFSNANMSLSFDGNAMNIDTFIVKREDGYLSVSGEAAFDSSMITGRIVSSTLKADADKFFLARHKDYEIQIDANTFIQSVNKKQEFGGKIKVLRSDFYLPAFIVDDEETDYEDIPLLVQATMVKDSIDENVINLSPKKKKSKQSNFMKSLTGRLSLEIPRNTWLKSEEMKIEIWGDLEIEKSSTYFELFGEVGINRGHYILYGKKLNIQDGKINFQGGETIDPILDFKAIYTYRGADKQKRDLELLVTERLSEPKINFTLDGIALPEADAVSILLFGKTMDEMSYAGQNGIVGSMGTNMVAQMVTSQLSKTIGTRFQLDMIEVNATENWQSAAFVVGKYITNDLFVIYQRGFGETEGDEITPETVTLEYELNRILFFRLQSGSSKDSGFDVILKFESKKD
ncbi:translocation/assembly module TamB domain-containing protein [Carboxylicivirga sp. N1Y90]|uniref:translocation/assembly module TamB domain-containing protein n=1 Tax=Carboxylicivirga fragile TaxID=3417571 RepID=UPI003D34A502|nr:translocation/assembly module TamB domain-containing protein [Marinilabiliaceae bacterium N1Y90]